MQKGKKINNNKKILKLKAIKRFLVYERIKLIEIYLCSIYVGIFLYEILSLNYLEYIVKYSIEILLILFGASVFLSFLVAIIHYCMNQKLVNGICFKVLEEYKFREQYERFLAIKKCIKTFTYNSEKCDVKTNISVIEAAIEHDQAYSVLFPILTTIISVLFFEKDIFSITSPILWLITSLLVVSSVNLLYQIPRNAFIKKVIENIKEENINIT